MTCELTRSVWLNHCLVNKGIQLIARPSTIVPGPRGRDFEMSQAWALPDVDNDEEELNEYVSHAEVHDHAEFYSAASSQFAQVYFLKILPCSSQAAKMRS